MEFWVQYDKVKNGDITPKQFTTATKMKDYRSFPVWLLVSGIPMTDPREDCLVDELMSKLNVEQMVE